MARKFEVSYPDGSQYTDRSRSAIRQNSNEMIWSTFKDVSGAKVLEIGPRLSRWFIKKQLELNNCQYYSISASWKDARKHPPKHEKIKNPGSYKSTTKKLLKHFEADFFDYIFGIQSFEHWTEISGPDAYQNDIEKCHKILKSGGWFIQEFPVCHHGHDIFVYRQWDKLQDLFSSDKWCTPEIVEFGKTKQTNTVLEKCKHTFAIDDADELKCKICAWNGIIKVQKI